MSISHLEVEKTASALAYRQALVPVLKTILKELDADALYLWEIFDDRTDDYKYRQVISTEEKESLCRIFYKFLQEKKSDFVSDLTNQKAKTPNDMIELLKKEYSILKFVDAVADESKFQPLEFGYGEMARPRKYVVLDSAGDFKTVEYDSSTSIPDAVAMEGITAYHARVQTEGIYSREQLSETFKDVSIGLNHDRIRIGTRVDNKLVDRCEHLLVLPLKLGQDVIGVLKAENYVDRGFQEEAISKVRGYLGFLADFIVDSQRGVQALTYQQLCKGEKLAKHLRDARNKLLSSSDNQINPGEKSSDSSRDTFLIQVLDCLIHLFDVFNRGTYIGWPDIAGRINHFVKEITPILDLPEIDLFEKLEKSRRYDELLFEEVSQYREHFIHQFHTFVLGLLLIIGIGTDRFANWANAQLEARSKAFGSPRFLLDQRSIIRIWFMTSFYHDYAYILQRFDEGMGNFIQNVLRLKGFQVKNDWSQVFRTQNQQSNEKQKTQLQSFSQHLTDMSSYLVSGEYRNEKTVPTAQCTRLVDQIWNAVLNRQDHGPLSVLVLLDTLVNTKQIHTKRVDETYLAALAIACHHEGVFEAIAALSGEPFLTLEGLPFVFLLVYCDTAQEWGRRKKEEKSHTVYTSPMLESVLVRPANEEKDEMGSIITTICYDSSDVNVIPKPDFIKKITASKEQSFKSRNYQCIIEYIMSNHEDLTINQLDCSTPITSIRFECVGQGIKSHNPSNES